MRIPIVMAAAVAIAACSAQVPDRPSTTAVRLPEAGVPDAATPPARPLTSRRVDVDGPGAVATAAVAAGLAAQGLTVVDIGADVTTTGSDRATVRVAATHSSAAGPTRTRIYDIALVRDHDDRWVVDAAG